MVQKLGGGGFGTVYMVQVTFSSVFRSFFLGEYRDCFPEENQQRDVCCQAPEAHQARRRGLRQERAGDLEQGELGHQRPVEIIQGEDEGVQSHP